VQIYVALQRATADNPRHIVTALVLREADLELLEQRFSGGIFEVADIADFVMEDKTRGLLAVVASEPFLTDTVSQLCFRGLHSRVRVLMDSGLRPSQDWPSLFVRTSADTLQAVESGLRLAAAQAQKEASLFVSAVATTSTGLTCATQVLQLVSKNYRGEALSPHLVEAFHPFGRPSGWIHYTLIDHCPCPGCADALRAVLPAPLPSRPPLNPQSQAPIGAQFDGPIERLKLPPHTRRALFAAGILTIRELEAMSERQLLALSSVGRSDVQYIQSRLMKYKRRVAANHARGTNNPQ